MLAYERMKELIDAECLFCVPTFIRSYITKKTLERVRQENPELYKIFNKEEEPGEEEKKQMKEIVNAAMSLRIKQHFENRAKVGR